jgi:hypothetical protein
MTLHANVYSGEHRVRGDLTLLLQEHGYELDSYSIADRAAQRVIVVRASRNRESGAQTTLNFNSDPSSHPDEV